jgi:hypothetical protein
MSSGTDRQRGTPWWRPRWCELLPELALVAGLTVFLVDETDAATSAFKSDRAIALIAGAAVVWIAGRILLARLVPWRPARTAVFGLAALGALGVVVLPAYQDETVVEVFPVTPIPQRADDSAATTATTTIPTTEITIAASDPAPTTTPPTVRRTPTTVPTDPVRLRSGPFMGIDHRASGTVSIYRHPDGTHVVGLEAFDIQPGPDYDVYVVPGAHRADRDGGARLDDLRGNRGTQYYNVPAAVDIGNGDWTVLIWCQTFSVPVANATPV